jgi:hypothetical protein
VEQQEAVASRDGAVLLVQRPDARDRDVEESFVARGVLFGGVLPVGQEREVQVALGTGEVVYLQAFDVLLEGRFVCEQHWNRDQRAQSRWDPAP